MKTNTIVTILITAAIVAGGLFFLELRSGNGAQDKAPQSLGEINRYTTGVANTSVLCNTSSTLLLATSSGRQYAAIVNDGSTNIYLELSTGPAVLYEGIRLNSGGGSYEINLDNLYTGPVYCIAATSAASTTIVSK